VCVSDLCRREAEIEIPTGSLTSEASNLTCTCGSELKKVYSKPTFAKLSKAEGVERFRELVSEGLLGKR